MAHNIKLICPTCKHEWQVDLDEVQAEQVIYRGLPPPEPKTKVETYRFKCPRDGAWVIAEVKIEE